jgi:hypothetical protein
MRKFLAVLILMMSIYGESQVGLNLSAGQSSFSEWNSSLGELLDPQKVDIYKSNYSLGFNYWFRLQKRRIEFLPALEYTQYSNTTLNTLDFKANSLNAVFNVNIYFLDLAEDCDCPTFSKKGNFLKKGLFLQISPELKQYNLKGGNFSQKNIVPGLRVALGVDLGASELVTITPMIGFDKTTMVKWDNLYNILSPLTIYNPLASNTNNFYFSTRFGFRFNTKKKFRR